MIPGGDGQVWRMRVEIRSLNSVFFKACVRILLLRDVRFMVLTYVLGICYVVRSTGKVAFAFLFFKFPYFWFPNFIGVLPGVTRC